MLQHSIKSNWAPTRGHDSSGVVYRYHWLYIVNYLPAVRMFLRNKRGQALASRTASSLRGKYNGLTISYTGRSQIGETWKNSVDASSVENDSFRLYSVPTVPRKLVVER